MVLEGDLIEGIALQCVKMGKEIGVTVEIGRKKVRSGEGRKGVVGYRRGLCEQLRNGVCVCMCVDLT